MNAAIFEFSFKTVLFGDTTDRGRRKFRDTRSDSAEFCLARSLAILLLLVFSALRR